MSTPPLCPRVVLEFGIRPEYRFVLKANYDPPEDCASDSPDLEIERQGLDAMGRPSWGPIGSEIEDNLLKYAVVWLANRLVAAEKVSWERIKEIDSLCAQVRDQQGTIKILQDAQRQLGGTAKEDRQTLADRIAELRIELDAAHEARSQAESTIETLQKELEKHRARES